MFYGAQGSCIETAAMESVLNIFLHIKIHLVPALKIKIICNYLSFQLLCHYQTTILANLHARQVALAAWHSQRDKRRRC